MKVDYVEEGSSLRHMDFELPAENLSDELEKGVNKLSRSVKLPGFRKGKIPKEDSAATKARSRRRPVARVSSGS